MNNQEEKAILYKVITFITSGVITIMLSISGWFIKENMNNIAECRKDITELKLNAERTAGNRFTSSDFVKAKEIIDQQQLTIDRRVTILEENTRSIKDLMIEIKADLKEIKETQHQK